MKSPVIGDITNVLFVICAVVIASTLVHREFFSTSGASKPETTHTIANWKEFASGQILGKPGGAVSLVVFSDYECPACRQFSAQLDTVRTRYPQLTVYYRNLPISRHLNARRGAFAAECAAEQTKFEGANKRLFTVGIPSDSDLTAFAQAIDIPDPTRFRTCVRDSLTVATVRRDQTDAARLSATGTPTLLLNDMVIRGAPPTNAMFALIDNATKKVTAH